MADDPKPQAGFLTGKKAPAPAPVAAEPEAPSPINIDPAKMVGFLKKKKDGDPDPQSPVPSEAPAPVQQNGAAAPRSVAPKPAAPAVQVQQVRQPVAQAVKHSAMSRPAPVRAAPVAAAAPPPMGDRATAEQFLHRGLDHYDRQETDQALAEYQACVQADPSFALGHNNLGMVLIDLERYDEAIASLYESIRCDPNYAEAYNNLGFVLRRMQRQIEAACAYRRFLEIEPDVEEGARISGWVDTVMRDNNLTELPPFSLPQYEEAPPEPEPEPAPAAPDPGKSKIKKMAAWEVAAGNTETAAPISILGEIESSPDTLKTATVLPSTPRPNLAGLTPPARSSAPALPAAASVSGAAAAAAPARKSNPAAPALRPIPPVAARTPAPSPAASATDVIERGMDAFAEGNFDKAAEVFQQAIVMEPDNAEGHTGLAKVLIRQEKYDLAIAELQQAVQLDPQDPAAFYVLGFALRAIERNVEASEAYETFLKLMPDARDSAKMRDWVKHIKGAANFMAPEDVYVDDEQIVTETDKKYKAALTKFQDGDADTALREAVRILNEDATHYRTRVLLGRIYLRQKSYDNAVEQLEGSLVTRPDYPEALYFLGQAFEKRGSLDQATITYKHYLDVAPQGPRAERLNEWLISHASGESGLSSQVQCELCLRFFPGSEIRQHEGKATCNNCLVVMGAAPTIVAPVKSAKTSVNSSAVVVTDTPPEAQGGSKKLVVIGGLFGTLAAVGLFLFMSHRLDPLLIKFGLKKPPEKIKDPTELVQVNTWVAPDASKVKFTAEPVLQVQPFSTWTYSLALAGLEDVEEKAKGWKKEYIVKEMPPGMENKDGTLVWRLQPSDYEKLKRGETYNVSVAIRGTAKSEDGQSHELFSVAKSFTLASQFGYEFGPELDLSIDPKDTLALGAGDLNGDTHADLVAASGQFRHGLLRQFINRGENQFAAPVTLSPPNAARYSAVWIGDLDGDKSIDILAANWQLGRLEPYFLDNNQPVPGKPVNIGVGPVAISAADFDGSKKLHVAVLLSVGHALAITDLSPDRKFSEVTTVPLPGGGGKGYVFPWYSDMGPGFVVVTPLAELPLHFVPYINGAWGKPISSAAGSDARMIVAATALSAGAGKPGRLVIATVSGKTSQVQLLQEAAGKFTPVGEALNVPAIAQCAVATDLNQDGQEDLALATPDEVRFYFCDPAAGLFDGPAYKASQLSGVAATLHGKAGARSDMIFLNTSNKAVVLRAVSSDSAAPAPDSDPKSK